MQHTFIKNYVNDINTSSNKTITIILQGCVIKDCSMNLKMVLFSQLSVLLPEILNWEENSLLIYLRTTCLVAESCQPYYGTHQAKAVTYQGD
jgi:hypothetical protein